MKDQQSFPLSWPASWPRAKSRGSSRFGSHSMSGAVQEILRQLRNLGVGDYNVVVSTDVPLRRDGLPYSNMRQPTDTGAAVYFKLRGRPQVLAVDKWNLVEDNLWAIAKDIEAQRGRIRWGVGTIEQAFAGYMALPAPIILTRSWREVLGFDATGLLSFDEVQEAYRSKAFACHPDHGGSDSQMAELNSAMGDARLYFGK